MRLLFLQESPMYEALGIHALAGMAKAAGHECDLLIESEERGSFLKKIQEIKPDLIAFSFMTRQQEWAIHKIGKLKQSMDVAILIGGTHPTMYPETLGHCEADYLCVGEGEAAIVELLNRMGNGGDTGSIPNIHKKTKSGNIANPIGDLIQNWNSLPLPDREIYRRYPFLQQLPLKRFITAFGCAYKCSFCYINNYRDIYTGKGKFFRRKSVERVLAEIEAVKVRYPMERIHFVDDLFSLDRKWLEEFLPSFWSKYQIPWSANVWIAHMDEPMVKLFKDNGCVGLTFGVEAGNEETRLRLIDKNLPNAVYLNHCRFLQKYKIPFHTGNIIGLPGEGLDKAFETARFNREIGARSTRAGLFWPFPGTKLTEYAVEHGMLNADYSVEYFNRGIYPKVKHEQVEELTLMANLFQFVAKYKWFETLTRWMLRYPKNRLVKFSASLVDQIFWVYEAHFFGLLNLAGFKYYLHLRHSLKAMRSHAEDARFKEDFLAQRPFWNISRSDLEGRVEKDGLT